MKDRPWKLKNKVRVSVKLSMITILLKRNSNDMHLYAIRKYSPLAYRLYIRLVGIEVII